MLNIAVTQGATSVKGTVFETSLPSVNVNVDRNVTVNVNTGCFFGIGALVFEKVLISETRGPILRNGGPNQRNGVSLNRTGHL